MTKPNVTYFIDLNIVSIDFHMKFLSQWNYQWKMFNLMTGNWSKLISNLIFFNHYSHLADINEVVDSKYEHVEYKFRQNDQCRHLGE